MDVKYQTMAIEVIKKFEGLRLSAYPDPASGGKPYTIGYGSTRDRYNNTFAADAKITKEEAEYLLANKIKAEIVPVLALKIPHFDSLSDGQKAAAISFAYNLGTHFYGASNFKSITNLYREPHNYSAPIVYQTFGLYVMAAGKKLPGLVSRRQAEAALFLS